MNESTGGALLLDIVFIVMALMIAVFVASFAYTKAYKAKTMAIDIIEQNAEAINNKTSYTYRGELKEAFSDLGYNPPYKNNNCKLEDVYGKEESSLTLLSQGYDELSNRICIGKLESTDESGNKYHFYAVETYMYFDIPLIKFSIPVRGETKIFYDTLVNIESEEI